MADAFKIGVAGLGVVGQGAIEILQNNAELIAMRAGRPIEVRAVSSKSRDKARSVDVSAYQWVDDARELSNLDDIDCVVELIGGEDGIALELAESALESGKHIVTANKAMMARNGLNLARKAEFKAVAIKYEAAVAGGIPAIKTLSQGLAANKIRAVYGILNGTCNYMLTEMGENGSSYEDVYKDCDAKGFLEADPSLDVDGIDAAHKLCILTSLAFGVQPDLDAILSQTTGISAITSLDFKFAHDLGYKIKLLGRAFKGHEGRISASVAPCLVPKTAQMANVDGSFNAVVFDGDFVDQVVNIGRGAGAGPTASAVVADLIDIARGDKAPVFTIPAQDMVEAEWLDDQYKDGQYYIHLSVEDKPGVLANISSALSANGLSIEELLQRNDDKVETVSVVLTTHKASRAALDQTVEKLKDIDSVITIENVMRIVKF